MSLSAFVLLSVTLWTWPAGRFTPSRRHGYNITVPQKQVGNRKKQCIFFRTTCVSKVVVFLRPFERDFRPTIWFALEFRRRKLYVDWKLRHPGPCVEVSCASPCPRWKQPQRIEVPMGYLTEVCTSSASEHDFGFQAAKALVTQRLPDLHEADTWPRSSPEMYEKFESPGECFEVPLYGSVFRWVWT